MFHGPSLPVPTKAAYFCPSVNLLTSLCRGILVFFFLLSHLRKLHLLTMLSRSLSRQETAGEKFVTLILHWGQVSGWWETETKQAWEKAREKNTIRFPLQKSALAELGSLPDPKAEHRFPESDVCRSPWNPLKKCLVVLQICSQRGWQSATTIHFSLKPSGRGRSQVSNPQWFMWVSALLCATESLYFSPIWWFKKLENYILGNKWKECRCNCKASIKNSDLTLSWWS